MINHKGLYGHDFWAPPGGGVDFGESLESCLTREFLEETGLQVDVRDQQFVCEFIKAPLHAIEIFFNVTAEAGQLLVGRDPEMGNAPQIIHSVKFMTMAEVRDLPENQKHGVFGFATSAAMLRELTGYLKI